MGRAVIFLLLAAAAACTDDGTSSNSASSDDASSGRDNAAALGAWDVPLLIDMLEDDDTDVREAAAKRLAALGREALPVYAKFLTDESDPARAPFVKLSDRVSVLGASAVPPDYFRGMQSKMAPADRRAGAAFGLLAGLDGWDDDGSFDVLAGARTDKDEGARAMAAASLALVGWGRVAERHPATDADMKPVMPGLANEEAALRFPVYWLIGLLLPRGKAYEDALTKPKVEDDQFDTWAGEALGRLKELDRPPEYPIPKKEEIAEAVKKAEALAAGKEKYPGSVLHDLRRLGPAAAAAAPALKKYMRGADEFGRVQACGVLLKIEPESRDEVAGILAPIIGKKDFVGFNALRAMPRTPAAVPALRSVLAFPHAGAKGTAADRLAKQGGSFAFALRAKRLAVRKLAQLGKDAAPAADDLRKLLDHPDARIRYGAARALRSVG